MKLSPSILALATANLVLLVCLFVLFKIGLDTYLHKKEYPATVDNQLTKNHE